MPGIPASAAAISRPALLLRLPAGSADACFAGLKACGVLVKDLNGAHPLLSDCLRVTVGTPEENGIFLSALVGVL